MFGLTLSATDEGAKGLQKGLKNPQSLKGPYPPKELDGWAVSTQIFKCT